MLYVCHITFVNMLCPKSDFIFLQLKWFHKRKASIYFHMKWLWNKFEDVMLSTGVFILFNVMNDN